MMSKIRFALALILISAFYGCRHDNPVPVLRDVNVSLADAENITMNSKDILWFENSGNSLLYDITNLCPIGDNAFVVQ